MNAITAIVRNGRFETHERVNLPDGTEVRLWIESPTVEADDLPPTPEEIAEEKEMALLARGEATIDLDVDGNPVIRSSASAQSSTGLPEGSKRPFQRISGWNKEELTAKYAG